MDPNEALKDLREALAEMEHPSTHGTWEQAACDLMDAAFALDEWLSKGGFLPEAWQTMNRK